MSDRLSALRSSPRKYSSPPRHRYRSRQCQPHTPPPQQQNNRLDFLKEKSAPRKAPPPKHVVEKRQQAPKPMNDRFQYLKQTEKKEPVKKKFVAMVSQTEGENGWRPGWMLRENKPPPERYEVALKMYKHYIQTGEILFPDLKKNGDKAKQLATQYMLKGKKSKN